MSETPREDNALQNERRDSDTRVSEAAGGSPAAGEPSSADTASAWPLPHDDAAAPAAAPPHPVDRDSEESAGSAETSAAEEDLARDGNSAEIDSGPSGPTEPGAGSGSATAAGSGERAATEVPVVTVMRRRAPRYGRFIFTGLLLAGVICFVAALVTRGQSAVSQADVFWLSMLWLGPLAMFAGAVTAFFLDRRSLSRTAMDHASVELFDAKGNPLPEK